MCVNVYAYKKIDSRGKLRINTIDVFCALGTGEKLVSNVTIKDVARKANVSIASASRALNGQGRIAAETKERILKIASDLSYSPHIGARSLITKKTEVIGILLPGLHGEFFSEMIRGIDEASLAHNYQLLLSSYNADANNTARAIAAMRGRVDGIIIMVPYNYDPAEFADINIPYVIVGAKSDKPQKNIIGMENFQGAQLAVNHLYERGARKIAFLSGPAHNLEAQQRQKGYESAINEFGISPIIFNGDFTENSGKNLAKKIIELQATDDKIDGIFCANDMMAIGLIQELRDKIKIPQELKIVGFDDVPIARYMYPELSTIHVKISQIGKVAFDMIVAQINNEEFQEISQTYAPELIVRQSS